MSVLNNAHQTPLTPPMTIGSLSTIASSPKSVQSSSSPAHKAQLNFVTPMSRSHQVHINDATLHRFREHIQEKYLMKSHEPLPVPYELRFAMKGVTRPPHRDITRGSREVSFSPRFLHISSQKA